jgi:hypothetical protein
LEEEEEECGAEEEEWAVAETVLPGAGPGPRCGALDVAGTDVAGDAEGTRGFDPEKPEVFCVDMVEFPFLLA